MNISSTTFRRLFVLLVIAAVGSSVYLVQMSIRGSGYHNQKTRVGLSNQQLAFDERTLSILDWKEFRNRSGDFSFSYPKDWDVEESSQSPYQIVVGPKTFFKDSRGSLLVMSPYASVNPDLFRSEKSAPCGMKDILFADRDALECRYEINGSLRRIIQVINLNETGIQKSNEFSYSVFADQKDVIRLYDRVLDTLRFVRAPSESFYANKDLAFSFHYPRDAHVSTLNTEDGGIRIFACQSDETRSAPCGEKEFLIKLWAQRTHETRVNNIRLGYEMFPESELIKENVLMGGVEGLRVIADLDSKNQHEWYGVINNGFVYGFEIPPYANSQDLAKSLALVQNILSTFSFIPVHALGVKDLQNAFWGSFGVQFHNGTGFVAGANGEPLGNNFLYQLTHLISFGDLDGDKVSDVAAIVSNRMGNKDSFSYLAAVINSYGNPLNAANQLLGDASLRVTKISVDGQVITVWMREGLRERVKKYRFQEGMLRRVE